MRFPHTAELIVALMLTSRAGLAHEHTSASPEPMTNARLAAILERVAPQVQGQAGQWRITRDGIPVMILTDESHNRMRVIAPIAKRDQVSDAILERMLEANFATALDARYAGAASSGPRSSTRSIPCTNETSSRAWRKS